MYYNRFEISEYSLILVGDCSGLQQLIIDNGIKNTLIPDHWIESSDFFNDVKIQLCEYFTGKRISFNVKLNLQGTPYQQIIWKNLLTVPYGDTASYKDIATMAGNPRAARAVGLANNRNPIPIIIPCHRVVGSNGKLTGYGAGLPMKQHLLNLEFINIVFTKLSDYYKDISRREAFYGKSWWPGNSVVEMMTGAILTQNTNWNNVEKAMNNLGDNPDPEWLLELPEAELATLIRPSGYHYQKAKKLKALMHWYSTYDYSPERVKALPTEEIREELLAINGVGRETADSILVYSFGKPSFVIDAYTRRIFSRLGMETPQDYDDFRIIFEQCIPEDTSTYDIYHGLVVEHAKKYCTMRPRCKFCPLNGICKEGKRLLSLSP